MSEFNITYSCRVPQGSDGILAPGGMGTPHGACTGVTVKGGSKIEIKEAGTGQEAFFIRPTDGELSLQYRFDDAFCWAYPREMFDPHPSRFSRFADALVAEAQEVAAGLEGRERAVALACATADRFTYGHPEERFNDGCEEIPALGCGLVEGSCVDINTYFLASLRAAGIKAGYVTGFFFPDEKGGVCEDGHCWVVTCIDRKIQEWDIAHHLKLGTRNIAPGLNPKPGFRAACFHSMGLNFPEIGVSEHKALIEPAYLKDGKLLSFEQPEIKLNRAVFA